MTNAVDALRLKQELVSFFDNADPKGPDAAPISALHRGHDGYITFHSKLNDDGTPSNKARMTCAIRADALEGMFPQFANALAEDAYFSVNAFAVPNADRDKALVYSPSVYSSTMTRYLCAAHVDIDCYARGIPIEDAVSQVVRAQVKGDIPAPSVYAYSGRGLWLFWFLRDEDNPLRPPRSFPRNAITWTAIQRKVLSIFGGVGSDANASTSVTQITRIPGSENSKSGEAVKWLIAGKGNSAYTYTLKELAERLGVTQADKNYAVAAKKIPNNAKGHVAVNKNRMEQFELLRQIRGGFKEGHRNSAILIYSHILRSNKVPPDDLIEAVEVLARECDPSYPSDDAVKTAVVALNRDHAYWFRNQTISDRLDVTPDEHGRLSEHFETAWPPASRFGLRKDDPERVAQLAAMERQQHRAARRKRLVQLFSEDPNATYRQLGSALRQEGFSGSAPRSVMLDLERLGLKTRVVRERETAHHLRQLQDSMLTDSGRLPPRRGR